MTTMPVPVRDSGATLIREDSVFRWHRAWPYEWELELRSVSPVSRTHDWLLGWWEPGTIEEQGQRWTLYRCMPYFFDSQKRRSSIDPAIMEELRGPDPRTLTIIDKVSGEVLYAPTMITRTQWDIYQATGCYGKWWWTIQGSQGGHRRRISDQERIQAGLTGGMTEMPAIGDLPYAPFDNRVVVQIQRHNILLKLGKRMNALRQYQGPGWKAQYAEAERDRRKLTIKWIEEQMQGPAEAVKRAVNQGWGGSSKPQNIQWDKEWEQLVEAYTNTGDLTPTPRGR